MEAFEPFSDLNRSVKHRKPATSLRFSVLNQGSRIQNLNFFTGKFIETQWPFEEASSKMLLEQTLFRTR